MALTPAMRVAAPQPRGLRYGLFTAANGPLELAIHARAGGVAYVPDSCGRARRWPIENPPDGPAKVFDTAPAVIEAEPVIVYGSLTTGSAGYSSQELIDRVTRNLESGEQTQAEAELAERLAAADTALGAATNTVDAVSTLEQWLYGTSGYGHVGYLHASPDVAAYAADAGLVVQNGPLKVTPYGSIWSIGGGYPAGTVYATGQVTVWRASDIAVTPPDQVLDRSTNQYHLIAEREYALAWDCLAASVTLTLGA